MKNILLLSMFLLSFEVKATLSNQYSENGISIYIRGDSDQLDKVTFQQKGKDLKIEEYKRNNLIDIFGALQNGTSAMELDVDGDNSLSFSFKFLNSNGGELYLQSVKQKKSNHEIEFALFEHTEGGGQSYTLFIEKNNRAYAGLQGRKGLQKVAIQKIALNNNTAT